MNITIQKFNLWTKILAHTCALPEVNLNDGLYLLFTSDFPYENFITSSCYYCIIYKRQVRGNLFQNLKDTNPQTTSFKRLHKKFLIKEITMMITKVSLTLELRRVDSLLVAVWHAVSRVSMSAKVDLTLRNCS